MDKGKQVVGDPRSRAYKAAPSMEGALTASSGGINTLLETLKDPNLQAALTSDECKKVGKLRKRLQHAHTQGALARTAGLMPGIADELLEQLSRVAAAYRRECGREGLALRPASVREAVAALCDMGDCVLTAVNAPGGLAIDAYAGVTIAFTSLEQLRWRLGSLCRFLGIPREALRGNEMGALVDPPASSSMARLPGEARDFFEVSLPAQLRALSGGAFTHVMGAYNESPAAAQATRELQQLLGDAAGKPTDEVVRAALAALLATSSSDAMPQGNAGLHTAKVLVASLANPDQPGRVLMRRMRDPPFCKSLADLGAEDAQAQTLRGAVHRAKASMAQVLRACRAGLKKLYRVYMDKEAQVAELTPSQAAEVAATIIFFDEVCELLRDACVTLALDADKVSQLLDDIEGGAEAFRKAQEQRREQRERDKQAESRHRENQVSFARLELQKRMEGAADDEDTSSTGDVFDHLP